jgi:peptide/nickel transport system substrate-binding protein
MKSRLKVISTVLVVLLMAMGIMLACAPSEEVAEKTLVIRLERDPNTLQWAFTCMHHDMPGYVISTSLVTLDKDGNPIPRLAKSWEVSEDGMTYTFKLKEWVWSDGEPVTSEDVKFSIEQVLLPYNPWGKSKFGDVRSVETPDKRTVVIQLQQTFDLFTSVYSMYGAIVPKHVYEGTDMLRNPANWDPVVAGPYKLGEYVKGSHVSLVRNPTWAGEDLYFDRIIYRIIPEADAAVMALQKGEIDIIPQHPPIPPRDVVNFQKNPDFQAMQLASPNGEENVLFFNGYLPPLDKQKVRQAIAYAIDIQPMVDSIYFGTVNVAKGHVSHEGLLSKYSGDFLGKYKYDPDKAKTLLDEAGYSEGTDGVRFTLKFIARTTYPEPELLDAIAGYLKDIGIMTKTEVLDSVTWGERVFDWEEENPWQGTHMAVMTTTWTAPPNLKNYYHSSRIMPGTLWSNAFNFSNPEFDAAIDKALSTTGEEHVASVVRAQEILAEELPTYPMMSLPVYQVADTSVKGLPMGYGLFPETPLPPFELWREAGE